MNHSGSKERGKSSAIEEKKTTEFDEASILIGHKTDNKTQCSNEQNCLTDWGKGVRDPW